MAHPAAQTLTRACAHASLQNPTRETPEKRHQDVSALFGFPGTVASKPWIFGFCGRAVP